MPPRYLRLLSVSVVLERCEAALSTRDLPLLSRDRISSGFVSRDGDVQSCKKKIYIYTFFLDRIVAEERSISSKFPFEFSSGTGRIELLIIFTIAIRRLGKDQHVTSVVVTREEKSARAEARARGRRAITFDRAGIARSFDSSVIAVRVEFQRRVVTIE